MNEMGYQIKSIIFRRDFHAIGISVPSLFNGNVDVVTHSCAIITRYRTFRLHRYVANTPLSLESHGTGVDWN